MADTTPDVVDSQAHYHTDEQGVLVRCYHKCRRTPWIGFIVGLTVGYPLEHLLWEHVWPFKLLMPWIGLH